MADSKHTPGPWETGQAHWNEDGDVMYTLHGIKEAKVADCRLVGAAPDLLDMLNAIKRHGELACVDAHPGSYFTGGKKPATKDVFQFPRHLLTGVDAAIAKAEGRS